MLNFLSTRIYLATGITDMRKGINGLSLLVQDILSSSASDGSMFVFRGRTADRIKVLWWDGQGFCLFYKYLDNGKFMWPSTDSKVSVGITSAQLPMLMEGMDWRNPSWSEPPKYAG